VQPKRLFISYSSSDEKWKKELETHLSALKHQGLIETWDFRKLHVGDNWDATIKTELAQAEAIILLISADFLASGYCWHVEMMRALERHKRGECLVVPVIVRECDWQVTPLGDIQALPANGKPVMAWHPHDKAWKTVAIGIREALSQPPTSIATRGIAGAVEAASHNPAASSSGMHGPGGLAAYHAVYPKREMIDHLGRAERYINILQTWISNWSAFWVAMQSALRIDDTGRPTSDVQIRVILIDPRSNLCAIRGEHSGVSAKEAIDHTKLSVRRLREFKRQFRIADERLAIRLSNELPTFAMFATEAGTFFNPYLRQRITYESPCLVFLPVESGFANELSIHFNGLWDKLGQGKTRTLKAG
jgi:hypothetical protein